jgi:hypothetical protein
MKKITSLLLCCIVFTCMAVTPVKLSPLADASAWTALLKKYVSPLGKVDYKGFIKDSVELNKFLKSVSDNPPLPGKWSKEEQIAYWLNAYNAFTVQIVIRHYPLKSIKDIGSKIQIPFVNTPWDLKFIHIGGKTYDLNNLEHGIIRKFNEPRIHFAVNCASFSCPKLRTEAYTASKLNEQLDEQAKLFINNTAVNKIAAQDATVSKLFSWFSGDFKQTGKSVIEFINQYSTIKMNPNANLKFMDYNWSLNE